MRGVLDIRRLRYFLAIAGEGSISGAARALNVAQPALSYHVAEMERLTGLILMVRSRDGIRLTREGEVLRSHAAEIVRRTDSAERALEALSNQDALAPPLRLAIITSLAADLTPLLVRRMRETKGAPTLSIMEAGTRDIEARLTRGRIDMALCLDPAPGIDASPIAREDLWFVAPSGTTRRRAMPVHKLADYRLVLPAAGNPLRKLIAEIARDAGFSVDVVLEVDGPGSRYNAVVNGIGCTLLGAHSIPASAIEEGLCVLPFVEPGLNRPIFLGRRKGLDSGLAEQMRSIISSVLTDLGLFPLGAGTADSDVVNSSEQISS